jgi:hypothetical protein
MSLPTSAGVKVTWDVRVNSTTSASLIPGGSVTVFAPTDPEADALIAAELTARKATNQANVDLLDEVISKL